MGTTPVVAAPRLTRVGQQTLYKGFPIKRKSLKVGDKRVPEFHVYMGFDTQEAAETWIDDALAGGFIKQPKGLKPGAPSKQAKV